MWNSMSKGEMEAQLLRQAQTIGALKETIRRAVEILDRDPRRTKKCKDVISILRKAISK